MIWLGSGKPGNEAMFATLRAHAAPIAVFVLANAFMEELLFRGLFLAQLRERTGGVLAVTATSLAFALAHVNVGYETPDALLGFLAVVLVLGVLWGATMLATRSLLASVLFHAGADVVIAAEVFKYFGALS